VDDRTFDNLARRIGTTGTRRRVLVGIASTVVALAGSARGRRAAAQESSVGIGGGCSASGQCIQDPNDLAVVCADNGIATDGALNCCRNAGGGCGGGAGCCGALLCINGICTADVPTTGGGLAPGAQCTFAGACDQLGGETDCADNGIATDGVLNCCRYDGGSCADGTGCCGALLCVAGVCAVSGISTASELAPGTSCTSTSQCSQAGGSVVCADNGIAADGARNCCRVAGGACIAANQSAGCCSGLFCVAGVCQ